MYIARAIALGANGYLLKDCTLEKLIKAIEAAAAGDRGKWLERQLHNIRQLECDAGIEAGAPDGRFPAVLEICEQFGSYFQESISMKQAGQPPAFNAVNAAQPL
jgi:DNA-binding NarL/FixJ family response regulator